MFTSKYSKSLLAASCAAIASFCTISAPDAQPAGQGFAVSSTTFTDGGAMPARVAFTMANNQNCGGQNLSPELTFSNVPPTAKSFAITMVTAEVDDINMVVYGIPATVGSLPEGALSMPSSNFVGGKNRFGQGTWRGMCSPPGMAPHHYVIKVVAYDLDPMELPPGLTWPELQDKLKGHVKNSAAIVGTASNFVTK